jgi:TRAP-type C4-dicarboxylate transport system substrate-binding protein
MQAATQRDLDNSKDHPDVRRGLGVHDRRVDSQEVLNMVLKMSRLAGGLAGVTALTLACGGVSSDRAGGAANADPVVLTMAQNSDVPPQWPYQWADEVAARSAGSLQIEFANSWRYGTPDFESGTIEDVQAGEVDLAHVGARAFDRAGVTTFQPLLAPLLVDNHDLQAAVFDAGIPDEMVAGLDTIDLAGIGVLPGPMRKMVGMSHPFVAPADFAGQLVGIQDSALTERTMRALGATTQNMPNGDPDNTMLDGQELQLETIAGIDVWQQADYVTANINLWPRPTVLFMNAERFASLTDDQQQIMRDAAATIADDARAIVRDEDATATAYLCEQGMTLAVATDDDLASLRSAVQPVYDEIASDPDNAAWLDQIVELKEQVDAPVATTECPQTVAMVDTGDFPEGTFVHTVTDEDFEQVCDVEIDDDFESTEYAVFENGRLEHLVPNEDGTLEIGFKATYSVVRDRVDLLEPGATQPLSFHWTFDGTQLVLSDLADDYGECAHRGVWESQPWVLVEDDATSTTATVGIGTGDFPEGTFVATVTDEDFEKACGEESDDFEWILYAVFADGRLLHHWSPRDDGNFEIGFKATYSVVRDRIEVLEDGVTQPLSFLWTFDGTQLVFSDLAPDNCEHSGVWESHPWVLVEDDPFSPPETTEAT